MKEQNQKEQKDKQCNKTILYNKVFNHDDGKKVLEDLEHKCFYNRTTFIGDKDECVYREGMRSMILYINKQLNRKID